MSLYRKLAIFLLAATAAPLLAVGAFIASTAEDALRARIQDAQVQAVNQQASSVAAFMKERVDALSRAARFFPANKLTDDERASLVRLFYKSDPFIAAAVLVDEKGAPTAPAALRTKANEDSDELAGHPTADESAVQRLLLVAPFSRALAEGKGAVVLSAVYGAPERGETAVAVALPVEGPNGKLLVFAAELSLASLSPLSRRDATALPRIVDASGRVVAHADKSRLTSVDELFTKSGAGGKEGPGSLTTTTAEGPQLAAYAPVPLEGLGWTALVSMPEAEAFAPVQKMRATLGGTVASVVVLLLALSSIFVSRVKKGLDAVVVGADHFSKGDLAHRISPPPERELNELALTFNRMGDELGRARGKLERWTEELEATVEKRTLELKEAQARLVETQKLAAVGHLGAGVAHEINNPLAAVLGGAQNMILKKKKAGATDDDPELAALAKIERAAQRCREVTTTLLRFSQRSESAQRAPVTLSSVVMDAAALSRAGFEELGASLVLELAEPSPVVVGDAGQLVQVVVHLLSNARTALAQKKGGAVRIKTELAVAGASSQALIVVADDGKGIAKEIIGKIFEPFFTTKDVWSNLGLGLSVSFRIVEEHSGTLTVDSEVGRGTTVTVRLPTTAAEGAAR